MRFNPVGYQRFLQAHTWKASFSGAEANVAMALSNFGLSSFMVSKVPANDIGQCAVNAMRQYGVDTSFVSRGGGRLGVYFLEKGASQRPPKIIYDRAASAFSEAKKEDFDWKAALTGASLFHFTGITPAVGDGIPEIVEEALREAKRQNVTVSCDLNYRKTLWKKERAQEVMEKLMQYVDVFISNMADASELFGIAPEGCTIEDALSNEEGPVSVSRQLVERFPFRTVALTLRKSISSDVNILGGMLYDGERAFFSPRYTINMIDRVGGGDAFAAGVIYALVTGMKGEKVIDFAVASSCIKHTIENDFNIASAEEVLSLAAGNTTGRVVR